MSDPTDDRAARALGVLNRLASAWVDFECWSVAGLLVPLRWVRVRTERAKGRYEAAWTEVLEFADE